MTGTAQTALRDRITGLGPWFHNLTIGGVQTTVKAHGDEIKSFRCLEDADEVKSFDGTDDSDEINSFSGQDDRPNQKFQWHG